MPDLNILVKPVQLWSLNMAQNHMTDEGAEELSNFFSINDQMRKVDVSGNDLRRGLNFILYSLLDSKQSLRELNISSNRSINKAIQPLQRLIKDSNNLVSLNISDLNMRKDYLKKTADILVQKVYENNHFVSIEWDYDLEISKTIAL